MLAPTGTIAFMMDCDTTGIEPDIALIKYKKLVGEGFLKIVNQTVPAALRKLGYGAERGRGDRRLHQRARDDRGRPAPQARAPAGLRLRLQAGQRRAVHPLHGPRPDDGRDPAVPLGRDQQDRQHARGRHGRGDREGLPRGLEARPQGDRDLPRRLQAQSQPLSHRQEEGRRRRVDSEDEASIAELRAQLAAAQAEAAKPHRRRLPAERTAVTHKFDIAGHEGYITVGLYPDGQPGEIFLKMAKEGSTVTGLMDSLATTVSRGAPVRRAAARPGQQVRPRPVRAAGFTGNQEIPIAKSIVDYIFRWLGSRFLSDDEKATLGLIDRSAIVAEAPAGFGGGMSFGGGSSTPPSSAAPDSPGSETSADSSGASPHPKRSRSPLLKRSSSGEAAAGPPTATALRQPVDRRRRRRGAGETSLPARPPGRRHERPRQRPRQGGNGEASRSATPGSITLYLGAHEGRLQIQADAPSCAECGSIMVRNGSCYKCLNCGTTSGCS